MAHTFEIEVGNVEKALEKAKQAVNAKGGSLVGDGVKGNFSGKSPFGDISGNYSVVSGNKVKMTITKKSFMLPNGTIENEVRKFFA